VLSSVIDGAGERHWRLVGEFGQRRDVVHVGCGGWRFIEYDNRLERDQLERVQLERVQLENDRLVWKRLDRVVGLQRVDIERVDIGE
jgi:hypothetical protein